MTGLPPHLFGITARRRQRLRARPFPEAWRAILQKNVPYYAELPEADQQELQGHIQVLVAEKNFEGCGGLEMTEEIRVTIAARPASSCCIASPIFIQIFVRSSSIPTPSWPKAMKKSFPATGWRRTKCIWANPGSMVP